ncbi:hypothetical protein J1N35_011985 [Gossypium stocksii]|uniref:Uncharacterized protein n=1 Tax=Gossypium stocksii TaxID=47602 RepID=A0A9D3W3S0_9ROSI|nr:hypothetical protein J1N35_011985 [Gossypium stocksii]
MLNCVMVPLFLLELKYHGCGCVVYSVDLLVILVSTVLRRMRFETLSVELEDSNDVIDVDIDAEQDVVDDVNETKQLEFSPRKPRLASLAVALLVRYLISIKQENLDKGK